MSKPLSITISSPTFLNEAVNPAAVEPGPAPLAAAPVILSKPNGSGDVVEDSFHCIAQYPASVLMQLVYLRDCIS